MALGEHILVGIRNAGSQEKLDMLMISAGQELSAYRRELRHLSPGDTATRLEEIAVLQQTIETERAATQERLGS